MLWHRLSLGIAGQRLWIQGISDSEWEACSPAFPACLRQRPVNRAVGKAVGESSIFDEHLLHGSHYLWAHRIFVLSFGLARETDVDEITA